tara:strand:+ start:85 stop:1227 length:1143 start_codon:yes stop_codon:yes gene_type:complete
MRIIHIISSLKEVSGPTQSVTNLCNEQIKKNKDVTLVSCDFKNVLNPPHFSKTFPLGVGPKKLGRSPSLFRWLKSQCQENEKIILHNHSMWHILSLYGSWIKKNSNFKLIQSPRNALANYSLNSGSILKPLYWRTFQKESLKKVDCFHATSQAEYDDIRALGFKQPVAIIPNMVNVIEDIKAKKKVSNLRTLSYLGRFHPEKGLETLLLAWAEIFKEKQNWNLNLVGTGDKKYVTFLKKIVKDLRLERVQFLDSVVGSEKWQMYHDSDLFVLPSPSENFGMVVAEALACGTPVVTTNRTPWKDLPIKGAGWCVNFGVEDLKLGLTEAMNKSSDELIQMGILGKKWISEDFSSSKVGHEMAEVYGWLLSENENVPSCLTTN